MNTVIIINLNGNAFHVEDPGFQSLRAYLERAQAQLKENPDKAEIMADLEQAIADKCARFLRPHKNVLGAAEIDEVLKEMGPVQSEHAPDATAPPDEQPRAESKTAAAANAPKRLYQIREGAMLSGVCTGLAAYFNIDVTIVRIAFVLLTLLTSGIWILVYLAMMLVVPFANTGESTLRQPASLSTRRRSSTAPRSTTLNSRMARSGAATGASSAANGGAGGTRAPIGGATICSAMSISSAPMQATADISGRRCSFRFLRCSMLCCSAYG